MNETLKETLVGVVSIACASFGVAVFGYIGVRVAQKTFGPIEVTNK